MEYIIHIFLSLGAVAAECLSWSREREFQFPIRCVHPFYFFAYLTRDLVQLLRKGGRQYFGDELYFYGTYVSQFWVVGRGGLMLLRFLFVSLGSASG